MLIKWFLFRTQIGPWLLGLFERWSGLAVVDVVELRNQRVRIIGEVQGGD